MKIVYFSNYFNHHQKPFADVMNTIPNVEYIFICTTTIPEFRKKLGYQEITAKYLLDATISRDNYQKARELACNADVAIFSGGQICEFAIERLKQKKITFEVSERRFKRGYINMISPNLLKHQLIYWLYGHKAPFYMLCCSAYTANDFNFMNSFYDKCYKWAYFTKVTDLKIEEVFSAKRQQCCKIMWCARFIDWKHPEMCIDLAKRLKAEGLDFEINMYGNGPLLPKTQKLIQQDKLGKCVHLLGNMKNEDILFAMQQHNIFLFTSDQREGWGAVANEALSNGCTLVASDKIGAVPFLVKDKLNGRIFKSKDNESLYYAVKDLVSNRSKCECLSREAFYNMKEKWSPENGAHSLLGLINKLQLGEDTPFTEGPCSKAKPYIL